MDQFYQVVVKGHWTDSLDETRNIFHVSVPAGTGMTIGDAVDWVDSMFGNTGTTLIGFIHDTWEMYSIELREFLGGVFVGVAEQPHINLGRGGGDCLPHTSALVIVGLEASRGRAKKFIAGVREADQSSGRASNDLIAAAGVFGLHWAGAVIVGGSPSGTSGVFDIPTATFRPIIGYRVDTLLGTQRKRKQGRGI